MSAGVSAWRAEVVLDGAVEQCHGIGAVGGAAFQATYVTLHPAPPRPRRLSICEQPRRGGKQRAPEHHRLKIFVP